MATRHFYVYNECDKVIDASVEFVPLGQSDPVTQTQAVPPGNQRLLCTSEAGIVHSAAVTQDGLLHWARLAHNLSNTEYTHVTSCNCDSPNCPQVWPNPDSRQLPIEQDDLKSC